MPANNGLLDSARAIAAAIVADCRTIHQQPEPAYHEYKMAALVAERCMVAPMVIRLAGR